ncbi:DNA cytosine methyltransferase [Brevibacillus reuszeri]|uniref:DNA cytosine methyltransferase n=1 Tax=Brevibacillus reuszeri TaxID=54915 RepID=UPI000CCC3A52|nr:DNA cytosine methyltransferase [Brevibacillus reuszeri]
MSEYAKKFTVCSFYVGGGLLDYAFKNHFHIIWANEINPSAARCYQKNVGDHLVVGDIEELSYDDIPPADVYLGTPPCPDYSTDGVNRGERGETGKHIWNFFRVIEKKMPKVFLFENVSGLKARHQETLLGYIHSFKKIGYRISMQEIEAAEFGSPSDRKRVFLVGVRTDLGFEFQFPRATGLTMNVYQAIGNLPAPGETEGTSGCIPNHISTWTSPSPERIRRITSNPNPKQWHGLRRLNWNKQSHTLVAHIAKDGREFIHPSEDRKITVREMLRLMGMPDTFVIPAEVVTTQQYRLVGNGVAFSVGDALARALFDQMTNSIV